MDYAYFPGAPPPPSYAGHYMNMTPFQPGLGNEESNGSSPDHMDHPNFLPYDTSFSGFEASPMIPPNSGSPQQSHMSMGHVGSVDSGVGLEVDMDGSQQAINPATGQPLQHGSGVRGSSEEKELANLTPAQSRRKAQNRAAQRAFRERKERHVRDLEAKLTALESQSHSLQSDNERLKLALQRAETENEILRATSATNPLSLSLPGSPKEDADGLLNGSGEGGKSGGKAIEKMLETGEARLGPSSWRPKKIDIPVTLPDKGTPGPYLATTAKSSAQPLSNPLLNRRFVTSMDATKNSGSRSKTLLPAAATWDLILSHPLFQQGLIDIGDVCERLRSMAKCDGQGPAFEEADVIRVVEGARRGGGDELI
ncbi:hypothetical protein EV356DRAFT_537168 [Viridothelium virens]|uniref:BZIP domain-containing protein n=1 Tax=Viridothelium virens TaxID=1048519 RepID=A0A6A6GVJ4_VIRVR|nr:hypothetical protein EV356DRAFT_537168 [Viridothelium virens]